MVTHYCCSRDPSHTAEGKWYILEIQQETLMDEKNIAQMFCPICQAPLTQCAQTEECTGP